MTNTSLLSSLRIVFMGSPRFALPTLDALHTAGANLVGVVTQPDKPAGRGNALVAPPVKLWAEKKGVAVYQPKGLRKPENRAFLEELKPDLIIVVAYGKILPQEVLDIPTRGTVNVHASLLPNYRGPAPISAAILNGEQETGVTIMVLDAGMDTGPTLAARTIPIAPDDTTKTLSEKLSILGGELLLPTLEEWLSGALSPSAQDNGKATVCSMISKEDGHIRWDESAEIIARKVRAYTPWPGTWTIWKKADGSETRIKILTAHIAKGLPSSEHATPGTVFVSDNNLCVCAGGTTLVVTTLQPQDRPPMDARTFLNGHHAIVGSVLQ